MLKAATIIVAMTTHPADDAYLQKRDNLSLKMSLKISVVVDIIKDIGNGVIIFL